jgi:hypothetical protein
MESKYDTKHDTKHVVHTCVGEQLVASTQVLATQVLATQVLATQVLATQVPTTSLRAVSTSAVVAALPTLIEFPPDHGDHDEVWNKYTTLEQERQEQRDKQYDPIERRKMFEMFEEMMRSGWMAIP